MFSVTPVETYRRSCPLQRSTVFVVLHGVDQNYHGMFLADGEVLFSGETQVVIDDKKAVVKFLQEQDIIKNPHKFENGCIPIHCGMQVVI